MARTKKKHAANHERWLVSYADLLTLLFAFFVVMFASNHSDRGKAREISEAVDKAFSGSSLSPSLAALLGAAPASPKQNNDRQGFVPSDAKNDSSPKLPPRLDLASSLKALQTNLSSEIESGAVHLHVEERGIVIGFNAQVVFPSGGDSISTSVYPAVAKVAEVMSLVPNAIRLEGHTDSVPIGQPSYQA